VLFIIVIKTSGSHSPGGATPFCTTEVNKVDLCTTRN